MKQTTLLILLTVLTSLSAMAQKETAAVTRYREFQPATIHLTDGRLLKVPLANIFLKNSSLLYKSGVQTKEANIKTIRKVDFKDRTYYRIDTVLAYRVDSVNGNALYRVDIIDFVAWQQNRANNSVITSLDLSDMIGYSTADLADERDLHFPLIAVYYFQLDGHNVLVHERNLKRVLNKEKRRLMEAVMTEQGFSWTNEQSLMKLLRAIQ